MKAMIAILCMAPLGAPLQAGGNWQLAIHGGAGVVDPGSLSPAMDAAYRASLNRALEAGAAVLGKGGARIKSIGERARLELTRILERKVHLFLHVKVS